MSIPWKPKDPSEVYEYTHDWANRLLVDGVDVGDTLRLAADPDPLLRPSIVAETGDVVVDAIVPVPASAKLQYWVSGGTQKTKFVATVHTQQGRTYQESFVLPVKER